jgi:hypothetical protein
MVVLACLFLFSFSSVFSVLFVKIKRKGCDYTEMLLKYVYYISVMF